MDYQATLYDPVFTTIGVSAELTPGNSVAPATVTALDKTAGMVAIGSGIDLETIRPAAIVRMTELTTAGITRDDLEGGAISLNGATWAIRATRYDPSPMGQGDGLLILVLGDA